MYIHIYICVAPRILRPKTHIPIYMAVSHLFRDMIFLREVRSQMFGLYKEKHINAKICDLTF